MSGRPTVRIAKKPFESARTAADMFVAAAKECVQEKGKFFAALSGGSTPRAMHRLLAEEPYCLAVPWKDIHLFWVDDRCVPHTNPASNYGAAQEDFLDRIPVPPDQIHPMPTHILPEEGAIQYEAELKRFLPLDQDGLPLFDLIVLGIGQDGHTASLFPGQAALDEREKWVVAVKGGDPDVHRLTLTFPVLNQARQIVFLASGKEKASILKAVLEDRTTRLPAQRIQPVSGNLIWLLDEAAASLLSPEEIVVKFDQHVIICK